MTSENRPVDLSRHESDLALRATQSPPEGMAGRPLAALGFAVHGLPKFTSTDGHPIDIANWPWLGFDGSLRNAPQARFLRERLPQVRRRLRFDSMPAMAQAARQGAGVAALACFIAAEAAELVRIGELDASYFPQLWLLHHPDLRRSARVQRENVYRGR